MPHTPQRLCKAPLEECLPIKLHFMEFVKHFSRFFLKNFCPTIFCVFRPRNAQFLTTAVKKIKRNRRILANDREFTDDGGRSKPLPYVKFYGLRQTAPAFNFAFASARYFASLNMTNCYNEEEQSVMSQRFWELAPFQARQLPAAVLFVLQAATNAV